ncbi:MAG TPA: sugar phosphate isomerase/epimerase [Bryobacteraceae bacterium]|nr:sugar phosphate isomerase/epimerase [Bryobacteraceae bacterium]
MSLKTNRREILCGAIAAIAATTKPALAQSAKPDEAGFKLGIASYSLRKLSRAYAINSLQKLNVRYINIKDVHASLKSTPQELAQIRNDFESAGIAVLGVGNVDFKKLTADEMRSRFEYAKAHGAPLIVMAPSHETVGMVEPFVKEYNIKAAIHNHGPEDKIYPAPADILKDISSMDPRMGICVDIGHTHRAGADILQSIKQTGARLHDMHVKDLMDASAKAKQVAVGDGTLPYPAMFSLLDKMGYRGGVMLEYEINENDPIPGIAQSLGYMRGVIAGLGLKYS